MEYHEKERIKYAKSSKLLIYEEAQNIFLQAAGVTIHGALVEQFLSFDQKFNPDGSRIAPNRYASKIIQRLKNRTMRDGQVDATKTPDYDCTRESIGVFLVLAMLGQVDRNGRPRYRLEDVMDSNRLSAEKLALGNRIVEELNPAREDYAEKLREIDKAFLRGYRQLDAFFLSKSPRGSARRGCLCHEQRLAGAVRQHSYHCLPQPLHGLHS